MSTYIIHANLVLPDRVVEDASLLMRDDVIEAINPVSAPESNVVDLENAYLIPGLIDLHCDAIEKDFEPRPNVFVPPDFAVKSADARNMLSGITTVYQSVALDNGQGGVRSTEKVMMLIGSLEEAKYQSLVDHRIHLRYEVPDESSLPTVLRLLEARRVHLVSLMDHSPGQGRGKHIGVPLNQPIAVDRTQSTGANIASARSGTKWKRMEHVAEVSRQQTIPLASHDNDSSEQVHDLYALGARICEFPMDLETAHAAHMAGMATIVGAPNLVRGKSQGNGIRAIDAIKAGVASVVCSDYVSQTLLPALINLSRQGHLELPQAINLGTLNPAIAMGLADRGEIAVGKRADLVGVKLDGYTQIRAVWSDGRAVFRTK